MKKILFSLMLALVIMCSAVSPAYAAEPESSPYNIQEETDGSTVILFDDGSSITISPVYNDSNPQNNTRATTKTTSGNKDAIFKDSDGNIEWKYTLSASFSYVSGVSSTCTNCSYSTTTNDSSWTFSDGSATKSGNVATGKGKYVKKILFITVNTYNIDIHITCDTYGNLS